MHLDSFLLKDMEKRVMVNRVKFKYDKEDIKGWIADEIPFIHINDTPPSQFFFTFVNVVSDELKTAFPAHPRAKLDCFRQEERSGFVQCSLCFDIFVSFGSHLKKHIEIKHQSCTDKVPFIPTARQEAAHSEPNSTNTEEVRYRSIPEKMLTFIEIVQRVPQLWSPLHPEHNKKELTSRNWEQVVSLCDEQGISTDPNDARKNWKSLRDSYRRNLRLIYEDGKNENNIKWKFFPHLKFLFDHKDMIKEEPQLDIDADSPNTSRSGSVTATKRVWDFLQSQDTPNTPCTEPDSPTYKQPKLEDLLEQTFAAAAIPLNDNSEEDGSSQNDAEYAVAENKHEARPDKFDAFGQWVAAALREMSTKSSKKKITEITAMLVDTEE